VHDGAGVAQLAERQPSKLHVAGSNPVSRSTIPRHEPHLGAARSAASSVTLSPRVEGPAPSVTVTYHPYG
jgi:hypothetical protein